MRFKNIFRIAESSQPLRKCSDRFFRFISQRVIFLYGRHPEYFENAEHVRAAVEFVLAKPEEAGNIRDNLAFVREDQSTGKVYREEINPKIIGKRCQIRSVHEITQTQYKKVNNHV